MGGARSRTCWSAPMRKPCDLGWTCKHVFRKGNHRKSAEKKDVSKHETAGPMDLMILMTPVLLWAADPIITHLSSSTWSCEQWNAKRPSYTTKTKMLAGGKLRPWGKWQSWGAGHRKNSPGRKSFRGFSQIQLDDPPAIVAPDSSGEPRVAQSPGKLEMFYMQVLCLQMFTTYERMNS